MTFFLSNTFIKIMVGAAIVITVVMLNTQPPGAPPCDRVSWYPNKSAVYSCPPGFASVNLRNPYRVAVHTTITTSEPTEAWLTVAGDGEVYKTIEKHLGKPSILKPGSFLFVSTGIGLVYVHADTKYLLSVAWNVPNS